MRLDYVCNGRRRGAPLRDGSFSIGRSHDCDLVLDADGVSKLHATLEVDGDFVELVDSGSRNGVVVNGKPAGRLVLAAGDQIRVGSVNLVLSSGTAGALPPEASAPVAKNALLGAFQLRMLGKGRIYPLNRQLETLGSRDKNSILLEGTGLSRYHCKVEISDGAWRVKDLDSKNGVYWGKSETAELRRCEQQELSPGNLIRVGSAELVFEAKDAQVKTASAGGGTSSASPKGGNKKLQPIIAAVLAFVLILGAASLFQNPDESAGEKQSSNDPFETYEEAIVFLVEKLEAGEAEQGERILKTVEDRYLGDDRPELRPLSVIVKVWSRRSKPRRFPWAKVAKACAKIVKINVPLPVDRFAQKLGRQSQIEQLALQRIIDAESFLKRAETQRQAGAIDKAARAFESALSLLGMTPKGSVFVPSAVETWKRTRKTLFGALCDEGESRKRDSDWPEARRAYEAAIPYAPDEDSTVRLRKEVELCSRNIYDEGAYSRALEIIEARRVNDYQAALEMLATVRQDSAIYKSARAWYDFCQADMLARKASRAYLAGRGDVALSLLDRVLRSPGLQASDKGAIRQRRALWGEVVKAFTKGRKLLEKGSYSEADSKFQLVTRKVRSRANVYRRLAEARIAEIAEQKNISPDKLIDRGLDAAQEGRYEDAISIFGRVSRASRKDAKLLGRIAKELGEVETKNKLLRGARKIVLTRSTKNYGEARAIFRLCKQYLSPSDKRRDRAAELLRRLPGGA